VDIEGREFLIYKKKYPAGAILCKQGEVSDDIYILQAGAVKVIVDTMIIAVINTTGTFLGESAALLHQPRSATLEVLTDSEFMIIPGNYLDHVIMQSPRVGINLLKILAHRLRNTTTYLTQVQSDIINYRNEIRTLKGQRPIQELDLGSGLFELGLISQEQLKECQGIVEKTKDTPEPVTLPQILLEKRYINLFQLTEYLKSHPSDLSLSDENIQTSNPV